MGEGGKFKSPAVIVGLSLSPFNFVSFVFMYFEALLLGHNLYDHFVFLTRLSLLNVFIFLVILLENYFI